MNTLKINKSNESASRLAINLRNLMASRDMTDMSLANALKIPYMTIRRLTSGTTTDPRISTLMLISKHFNVNVDELIYTAIPSSASIKASHTTLVPVLTWELLETYDDVESIDLNACTDWQAIHLDKADVHTPIFALKSRPSMSPRFQNDTIFIINPAIKPCDGDSVLIKITDTLAVSLRELSIDAPTWQLHSYVPNSPSLEYAPAHHTILGVVILTLFHNRKKS